MPRRTHPIQLRLLKGNPKLSKKNIKERAANEIHIGDKELIEPENVRKNEIAHAMWMEIIKMKTKADADWITSADTTLITMLCMTAAEVAALEAMVKDFDKKGCEQLTFLSFMNTLDKKRRTLQGYLREIYWTPTSRVAGSLKKKKKEKDDPLAKAGFAYV
jgi:hypothetical protein